MRMSGRFLAWEPVNVLDLQLPCFAMTAAALNCEKSSPCTEDTNQAGTQDDQRERRCEQKVCNERGCGDCKHRAVFQRARSDADDSLHDNCQYRCLQSEKQRLKLPDISIERIEPAGRYDRHRARQLREQPRNNAAQRAMHEPAKLEKTFDSKMFFLVGSVQKATDTSN